MLKLSSTKKEDHITQLNKTYSYCRNHPIYTPADVLENPLIGLSPLTWQYKRYTQKKWYKAYSLAHIRNICNRIRTKDENDLIKVREVLLNFGGTEVCITTNEEYTINILERGQLWFGDRIMIKKGSFSDCHKNSAHLWSFNEYNTKIATGFALNSEGIWERHSWLVLNTYPTNKIIDINKRFKLYFGYILSVKECNEFYWKNS